ncbi:MAG: alkaline phosphatase D family protein [Cytophagales bacterium]|nr:alkaline phosphatase D family protein [Armatimonadota bacterium]
MNEKTFRRVLANPVTRRSFLGGAGALAGLVVATQMPDRAWGQVASGSPFTLGVASGDPLPDGVVLWTRLATDPLNASGTGGMPQRNIPIRWEVARDAAMTQIVQSGTVLALAQDAHSVHVELSGLESATLYFYRFRSGAFVSPVGRTKTAPAFNAPTDLFRFAFVSCSDYQNGFFAAYQRLAEEVTRGDLDLVVHLGDYLYEYDPISTTEAAAIGGRQHNTNPAPPAGQVRLDTEQLQFLADYRLRHAQYKTDPSLQEAHRLYPWVTVWDDHEIENNHANDIDEITDDPLVTPAQFLLQRAAAYKAYYEHMPLRRTSLPSGANMQLYRRLRFGNLAEFHMLDTRQYRTDQPVDRSTGIGFVLSNSDFRPGLPANGNPTGTLTGAEQEAWLLEGLAASTATWNVLGNQVMMAQFNYGKFIPPASGGNIIYNVDQWDGYGANRQRILNAMNTLRGPNKNFVVITGDIHSAWVHDLKANYADPDNPGDTVGTELVCSSVTADFPIGFIAPVSAAATPTQTPWTKYFNGAQKGYVVCTLTPTQWFTDFRYVETALVPGATPAQSSFKVTSATAPVVPGSNGQPTSWVVQSGVPGAVPV